MARKKKKNKGPTEVETELTPMIDVVFLLLIFFVLNLKFKVEEGEIESFLPKDKGQGTGTPQIDLNEVRLKLLWYSPDGRPTTSEKDGEGFVVIKIGRNPYNSPTDIDKDNVELHPVWEKVYADLEGYRQNYKGKSEKGLPVIIDAREQVPYQFIVRALNEVVRAKITDVTFAAPEKPY